MTLSKINPCDDFVALTHPFPRKKKFTQGKDLIFNTEPIQIKNVRKSTDNFYTNEGYAGKLSNCERSRTFNILGNYGDKVTKTITGAETKQSQNK